MTTNGPSALTVRGTIRLRSASGWQFGVLALIVLIAVAFRGHSLTYLGILVGIGPAYLLLERFAANRPITITVDNGVLSAGRLGTGRLDGPVAVGEWYQPWTGTSNGSVAHIRFGGRTVLVGGRGHDATPAMRRGAPARAVRVTLPSAEFARLIDALGAAGAGAPGGPTVHIELFDAPARGAGGAFRIVAPILVLFGGGLILGGVSFVVMLTVGTAAGVAVTYVATALIMILVVATVWWTGGFRRRLRPARSVRLEPGGIAVYDGADRRLAGGCPQWRPGLHVSLSGPGTPPTRCPVVEIVLPPLRPMTVGIHDARLVWPFPAPRMRSPRYLVGEGDWSRLVTALRRSG